MTVCGSCGSHEDDGSAFCGACGAFLEFVGQPREAAAQASGPAPTSGPAAVLLPSTATVPARTAAPPTAPTSAAATAPTTPSAPAAPLQRGTADARAPHPAVAGTGSGGGPADHGMPLGPVLPGAEAGDRRVRRGAEPVTPGDLTCPACSTGNPAGRAFCRRCGCPLVPAATPPHHSWSRRLLDALTARWRDWRRRDAGERPRRWQAAGTGGRRRLGLARISLPMHLITPVLLALALVGVSVPSLRGELRTAGSTAVTEVRRLVAPQHVPLRPVRVTASSAVPEHPAEHAADGVTTTHWAEGAPGEGSGQVLVLEYDRPVDVRRLGVRLGATGSPDAYAHDPRPERLRLVSGGDSLELVLEDTVELQDLEARLDEVRRLEVHVLSAFGGRGGTAASIAELTAFRVS